MISCKIIYKRDPNTLKITDKIQAVKAPNGKRSLLFDAIRNQINDDTKALTQYFKVYTDEFKNDFGDWENTIQLKESSLRYSPDLKPDEIVTWLMVGKFNGEDNIISDSDFDSWQKEYKGSDWIEKNPIKVKEIYEEIVRQNNLKEVARDLFDDEEYESVVQLLGSDSEENISLAQQMIYGRDNDKLDQNGEPKYEEFKDLFIDEEVSDGQVNVFDDETTSTVYEKELGKQLEAKMKALFPEIKLEYTNEVITDTADPDTFNQLIENDYFDGNERKYMDEVDKITSLIENKLKYKLRAFHGKYNVDDSINTKDDYLNRVLHDLLFNIGIYDVHSLDSLRKKLSSGEIRKSIQREYKDVVKKRDINIEKLRDFYSTKRLLNSYLINQQIDNYDKQQQEVIKKELPQLFGKLGRYKSTKQAIAHLKIKINGQRKEVDGKWIQPDPKKTQLAEKLGLKFTEKNFLTSNAKVKKFETLLNYFKIAQHDANTRIYSVVENELNRRENFFDSEKVQDKITAKNAEIKAEQEAAQEARERRREYEANKYKRSTVVENIEGLLGGKNIHDLDEMLESNNIDVDLAIVKNNGYPLNKTSTGADSILYDSIMTLPEVEDNKEIADKIKSLVYSDSFMTWFGDWQNDASGSSKIVDKNGEPKLVYHGSGREFDFFNEKNRGDTTGKWEDRLSDSEMSFMFTDSPSISFFYAIMERQGSLDTIKHLISTFLHKPTQKKLNAIYDIAPNVKNWVEGLKKKGFTAVDIIEEFKKIKNQYQEIDGLVDPRHLGNPNRYFNDTKEAIKYLIKNKEYIMKNGVQSITTGMTARFDTAIKKDLFLESVFEGNIATSIGRDGNLRVFRNTELNGKNIKDLTSDEYDLMVNEFKENYIKGREKVNDQLKAGGFNPKIYPVFLNVKNPNKKDFEGRPFVGTVEQGAAALEVADLVQEAYESKELDGSIIENISDPENAINYSVFKSNQIKSLFNKGTYDDSPNFYNQIKNGDIVGQANTKAMTVLINAIKQNQDTLPHEYAHHYIAWFRNTPMVQEGIKRFGSEEALVQAIGEQVVKQKGEAFNWWKKFVKWILSKLSDKQVLQILTDSFLQNKNINTEFGYKQDTIISPSDKIIYGHPGIGKTTALEKNKDQFIDWDVEFNKKRDKWIETKSKSKKGTKKYKEARKKYLINYKDHNDYILFVMREWDRVKKKANDEGKKLLASPHILLDLFPNDFDKVINMDDDVFIKRNVERGEGSKESSRLWKDGINKTLAKIDQSKIVTTDKYLSEILDSNEDVEDDVQYSLIPSSVRHQGQPTTKSEDSSVKINTEPFKSQLNDDGYTKEQIEILETYNAATQSLTGKTIKVPVKDLPAKLRKIFELKGEEFAEVYETIDETGKKGYVTYRVSNLQDLKKVKGQSQKVATSQEQSPRSIISRQRGTEMHDVQEKFLSHFATSDNSIFNPDTLREADVNLWAPEALEKFKLTDEYEKIKQDSIDIFLTKQKGNQHGSWSTHSANLQVEKLAMSMLHLYHQIQMTQHEINRLSGKNNKPIFVLEKPFLDKGKDVAGTMDIFVIFSDGSASIYDHKFTDLKAERKYFKSPTTVQKTEIDRIRKAQGLPVNPETNWYYQLPNDINLYKKEESWNAQIGRYAQMAKQLYGVTHIRQARILPVATTYTKVDSGRKDKNGDTIMHVGPGSQVEVLLTGIEDDLGVSQLALNIERTGDVNLDRFIDMLIKNKETLKREMKSKNAWGDPKYVNRIKKLDESIQALLKSRDITHISESIDALANQIENDLKDQEHPITFEQIILHLGDINMFETFIELSSEEINKLEKAHEDAPGDEENPYTTFLNRLGAANLKLSRQAQSMHNKMTVMIGDLNKEGGYMSEGMFKSFTKQKDMNTLGVYFTHLRESNHPIVSLFSQLLDGIETNVMMERSKLEKKLEKINKDLTTWGSSKGLSGTDIYKDIIDDEYGNLIRKFTNFKKDLFDDYSNQKNHKKNIAWFQENFERSSSAEKIFQDKFKQIQEYYKRETKGNKAEYNKEIQNWLNRNDVTHSNGDNQAWYNPYIQHWLTPKNPDEYYTDEYRNLLKTENKPLLDFYNIYIEQMNMLAEKADFRIYENAIPNIRKDALDTLVQDGMFLGGKQQIENIKNWWIHNDNDDGMQTILTEDGLERSVPIFYQNNVGKNNKSMDLSKSLMLFSDFVNKYNGIKNIEHASLAMRELVSKTAGIKSNMAGQVVRTESGEIKLKEGAEATNDKLVSAFDTWINYYVYGERKKGDVKINKAVDAITAISSRKGVALNALSAVGGHINAEAQLRMIAKKATYFTTDTLGKARTEVKLGISTLRRSKEANEMMHSKVVFANLFFEPSQEDMSHEKANGMSLDWIRSSKMGKQDYAYMLQRYSDDVIDNTTMTAMMMDYGIDPITSKVYPLSRLKKVYGENESEYKPGIRYKDIEFKSLWDMTIMKDEDVDFGDGKTVSVKIEDVPKIMNQFTKEAIDSKTFTDFRRKAKQMIARTKGNMSGDDIAGYKTHWIGRLVMQFRGWIPATVTERIKGVQYNLTMEQMEVGRLTAAKNMVHKNLKRTMGEFIKELVPFMKGNFGDGKVMSDVLDEQSPLELKYKQFIADNPHLKPDPDNPTLDQVTYEDFFNSHVSEMRALAQEVQIYLALAGALGVITMMSGDDELKINPAARATASVFDRAMLEIGFFIPIIGISEQYLQLTRPPASSVSLFHSAWKTASNIVTETYDLMTGAGPGKTTVPTLGDKPWTLDHSERADSSMPGKYIVGWIPPLKFMDSVFGFTNTTKREDTWWDFIAASNQNAILK